MDRVVVIFFYIYKKKERGWEEGEIGTPIPLGKVIRISIPLENIRYRMITKIKMTRLFLTNW